MSRNSLFNAFAQELINNSNEELQPLPRTRSPSPNSSRGISSLNSDRASLTNTRAVADSRNSSRKHNRNRTIFPMPLEFVAEEHETGPSPVKANHKIEQPLIDYVEDPILANEDADLAQSPKKRGINNWMKVKRTLRLLRSKKRFEYVLDERDREFQLSKGGKSLTTLEAMKNQFKEGYIDPQNPFLVVWKFFFEVGIIFYCLTFSYRLAFAIDLFQFDAIDVIEDTMDICFLINIGLNFVTAIRQPDGTLIKNKKVIAAEYLTGTFLIDIIVLIPYEYFYPSIAGIKMIRIIHLNVLIDYIRNIIQLVTKFIIKGFQATVVSNMLGDTITTILLLGILLHLITDVWIVLGFPKEPDEITWFHRMSPTTTPLEELEKGSTKIYLEGLYFMVQTILRLGNGNAVGSTTREYLYCIAILFLGILVFTAFFEKSKSIIASFHRAENLENEEVEELEVWLRRLERHVVENCYVYNQPLLEKVKTILRHRVDQDWQENFIGNPEFHKLDHKSREELLLRTFDRLKKKFQIFFKEVSDQFFHEVMMQSESMVFIPGEFILKRKRISKGIFFIVRGNVLLAGNTTEQFFSRIEMGSFFGEVSALINKKTSLNYIAEDEVHCLFVAEEVFKSLQGKYPDDMNKLRDLAYYRHKYFEHEIDRLEKYQKMDLHETEEYPSDKDVRLQTRDDGNHRDQSYFEDSRKSLLPKKEALHSLQKDLNKLIAENEFIPTPLIVSQGANKRFTFNLEKDSDHSQIMNAPPMSAENEGKRRFMTPASMNRSRDKKLTMDRLETIYTKRNRFHRASTFSVDNRNQTLTYLERLLISTEPDSDGSDISDDDRKPQDNNANNTDEEEDKDDDELNNSACFPLEGDVQDIKDTDKADQIIEYLEERITFLHDKLDRMKVKLHLETQYIGKKLKILRRRKLLDTLI